MGRLAFEESIERKLGDNILGFWNLTLSSNSISIPHSPCSGSHQVSDYYLKQSSFLQSKSSSDFLSQIVWWVKLEVALHLVSTL